MSARAGCALIHLKRREIIPLMLYTRSARNAIASAARQK
jgi:hypothetical protein